MAWSDRDWILEGANVHVSLLGFDDGAQKDRYLNGRLVEQINADLTSAMDTTSASSLSENAGICFQGPSPKGAFDITRETALKMLHAPLNVNGRPNSDVVRPVANAMDLVQRSRGIWTIDFGTVANEAAAAQYEFPFEYVKEHVYATRQTNNRESYKVRWWLYGEARPGMRLALKPLSRFIATPRHSKHRLFVWQAPIVLCNDATSCVFQHAEDHYLLDSSYPDPHEIWAAQMGTAPEDSVPATPLPNINLRDVPVSVGSGQGIAG